MTASGSFRLFVVVGTDHHPFDRLILWVDVWVVGARSRSVKVECLVQHGASRPPARLRRPRRDARTSTYRAGLRALYQGIAEVTGSSVIVDSSKVPAHGALLESIQELDVFVIHLVRDPRAVAYSWSTPTKNPGIEQVGVLKSSVLWVAINVATELLWRRDRACYLHLTYEQFLEAPRQTFERILEFIDERRAQTPFVGERTVVLEATHTPSGNTSRFRTGLVELRLDDEWETRMSPLRRAQVCLLTFPLMWRYRYRVLRPRQSEKTRLERSLPATPAPEVTRDET